MSTESIAEPAGEVLRGPEPAGAGLREAAALLPEVGEQLRAVSHNGAPRGGGGGVALRGLPSDSPVLLDVEPFVLTCPSAPPAVGGPGGDVVDREAALGDPLALGGRAAVAPQQADRSAGPESAPHHAPSGDGEGGDRVAALAGGPRVSDRRAQRGDNRQRPGRWWRAGRRSARAAPFPAEHARPLGWGPLLEQRCAPFPLVAPGGPLLSPRTGERAGAGVVGLLPGEERRLVEGARLDPSAPGMAAAVLGARAGACQNRLAPANPAPHALASRVRGRASVPVARLSPCLGLSRGTRAPRDETIGAPLLAVGQPPDIQGHLREKTIGLHCWPL